MPPPPPRGGARGARGAKGSGLNRKVAGIPVKYLVAAAVVVVGYLLYRHFRAQGSSSAGSTATPQEPTLQPSTPADSLGGGASGGGDIAPAGVDASQEALQRASEQLQDLVSSLLGGFTQGAGPGPGAPLIPNNTFPLAPATPQTPDAGGGNVSPSPATSPSQPFSTFANTFGVTSTIPGAAGSTQTTFAPRQIQTINQSPNALRTIGSDAAQSVAANIRYYTYKAQVPLARGQTVHFRSGKGYYAA